MTNKPCIQRVQGNTLTHEKYYDADVSADKAREFATTLSDPSARRALQLDAAQAAWGAPYISVRVRKSRK